MEQNLSLIIGKSVIGLLHSGVTPDEIAKLGALYGVRHRQNWASGLTILSAMANLCDHLEGDDRIAPLFHGLVHVARDCAGMTPKFEISPLDNEEIPPEHLKRWLRYFVEVRSTEGAERCVLTAVRKGLSGADIADMIVTAATDHFYLDGGHVVDFINKAFELLDRIGWDHCGPDSAISGQRAVHRNPQRGAECLAPSHRPSSGVARHIRRASRHAG